MSKLPKLRQVSSADQIKPQRKVPELIRVPADKPIVGVLLVTAPYEMPTHWTGSRTVICPGPAQCEHCPHKGIKMYYLVAILDKNSNVTSWVELTEMAGLSLMQQLTELQKACYGSVVRIGRERKTMKSPITVAIDQWARVADRLPKPMEPTETLERVFNAETRTNKARQAAV
jgi:hypothetical protein